MAKTLQDVITKNSKSSFYYTFFFLGKEKRKAMYTVYAFCRITDDIIDAVDESDEIKLIKLNEWEDEFKKALTGSSKFELLNSLADTIHKLNLSEKSFFDLIEGVRTDIFKRRYQTFEELKDYCYHVASTVGIMSIELFGYKNQLSRDYAYNLGIAMQLTNILRDIKDDAKRNYIYIPQEDLIRFSYSEDDLFNARYNSNFIELMKFEVERTEHYYQEANKCFHPDDYKVLAMGRAMQEIYYTMLQKIKCNRFDVFNKNNHLSNTTKILITLKNYIQYNLLPR